MTFRAAPPVDRQAELAEARAKNPDTVAWLYIPGAEVDDPVMQVEDNGYYLKLDENGEYAMWGCYYADIRCSFFGQFQAGKIVITLQFIPKPVFLVINVLVHFVILQYD